jgi:broad specificity phosphatase PhoE
VRLTLVRHGETTGQSSIRYYGATDVPLSDTGRAQMLRVRNALAGRRFDAVFASRLQRSREAAELIAGSEPQPEAAFDEVNFGRWEGWTRDEIAARDPQNFRLWQQRGVAFQYPAGESRASFHARVARGLERVLRDCGVAEVLMVLHRGVIAAILTELLQLDDAGRAALDIELGSIHVVERGDDAKWRSIALDRIDHLLDAADAARAP